jgi:hypothetical protein
MNGKTNCSEKHRRALYWTDSLHLHKGIRYQRKNVCLENLLRIFYKCTPVKTEIICFKFLNSLRFFSTCSEYLYKIRKLHQYFKYSVTEITDSVV